MRDERVAIGTVPLPEMSFRIPRELIKVFEVDPRVIRRHELYGIILPERLLSDQLREIVGQDFDVFLIPKH